MPYVDRDQSGKIVARYANAQREDHEWVEPDSHELAPTPEIPQSVTMRQARLALLQQGKLSAVNAAIAALPGADGDAARIEWEFSSTVERNRPLVQALAATLEMTEPQLDDLFTLAASL